MLKRILLGVICVIITSAAGCGRNYSPKPPEEVSFLDRAETQSRDGLTVTVAVLSREEGEEVFGVDLAANGVQPVWLDIKNDTKKPFFFMPIALDPDYATAHYWYSLYLDQLGRLDEAAAAAQKAVDLEPLSLVGTYAVGLTHYCARRFDRAREYAQRVLEVEPDYPLGLRLLGSSLVAEGRYTEAIAPYERLAAAAPGNSLYGGWLAHVYGRAGRTRDARAILSRLASRPDARPLAAANLAIGYIGIGDNAAALSWLAAAYDEHSQALTYLKIDPVYDPLRNDPKFADLLHRVGLGEVQPLSAR